MHLISIGFLNLILFYYYFRFHCIRFCCYNVDWYNYMSPFTRSICYGDRTLMKKKPSNFIFQVRPTCNATEIFSFMPIKYIQFLISVVGSIHLMNTFNMFNICYKKGEIISEVNGKSRAFSSFCLSCISQMLSLPFLSIFFLHFIFFLGL
jgi:hypothetical protein